MPDKSLHDQPIPISREEAEATLALLLHPWHPDSAEKKAIAARMLCLLETMGFRIMRVIGRPYRRRNAAKPESPRRVEGA